MSRRQIFHTLGATLLALLIATPAAAVVAPDSQSLAIAPPSVQPPADAARQLALSQGSNAWQRLVQAHGGEWLVRWEERNETVRHIQGSGIPMLARGTRDLDALAAKTARFLDRYAELFGVAPAELRFSNGSAFHGRDRELGIAHFDQLHRGVPVDGGFVSLRVKHGRLVQVVAATFPGIDLSVAPTLDGAYAAGLAEADARGFATGVTPGAAPELIVYPIGREDGFDYRLAWRLGVDTEEPLGRWRYVLDAHTGELIERVNRVHFVSDGTVTGIVSSRWTLDPTITVPMESLNVTVGGGVVETDPNGLYSSPLTGTQTRTVQAKGPRVNVINARGEDGVLSLTGTGTVDLPLDDTNTRLDERTVAHWVVEINNEAQDYLNLPWMNTAVRANVNAGGFLLSCNASWDGVGLNFYPGSICDNPGEFADVITHEWGHGLDDNDGNGIRDSGFSEGNSDVVGTIATGDCRLSPGFLGTAPLRDNCVFCPQSQCTGGFFSPHLTGQIYASAMWCTRENLITKMGEAAGVEHWEELAFVGLPAVTSINNTYDAILLADDDDGNLGNGTPNICEINPCFVGVELTSPDPSCAGVSAAIDAAETCLPGPFTPPATVAVTVEATNVSGASATGQANVVLITSAGQEVTLLNRNLSLGAGQQVGGTINVNLPATAPSGRHTVRLRITDGAGNVSESTACSFDTP